MQDSGLLPTATMAAIEAKIAADNVTDLATFSKVFTGANQALQAPSKAGDTFITDAGNVYISTGDAAEDWVKVN